MYIFIYSIYHLIYRYTHYLLLKSNIFKFCSLRFFKALSATTGSLSHKCWIHFYIIMKPWINLSIAKFTSFIYPYFACLRLDSSKFFWKALVLAIPFLSFKGTAHVYLLKYQQISITHSRKGTLLLNVLINSPNTVYKSREYLSFFKFSNNLSA